MKNGARAARRDAKAGHMTYASMTVAQFAAARGGK